MQFTCTDDDAGDDNDDAAAAGWQGGMLVCELCDRVYHPECCGQSAPRGEHWAVSVYSWQDVDMLNL